MKLTELYAQQVGWNDFTLERLTKCEIWVDGSSLQILFATTVQMGKPPVCQYGIWANGKLTCRGEWFVNVDGIDMVFDSFADTERYAVGRPSRFVEGGYPMAVA